MIWGGLSPDLLAKISTYPDLCKAAARVLETMYCAILPREVHVIDLVNKELPHYYNSLILFEVSDCSLHAVEPLTIAAERLSVNGWFLEEAYDFEHEFTAKIQQGQSRPNRSATSEVFTETKTERHGDAKDFVDFTTFSTTMVVSSFSQLLNSDLVSDLDFRQEGIISAISPAFALEITPRFSIGGAVNYYRNDPLSGDAIRSRMRATYSGQT